LINYTFLKFVVVGIINTLVGGIFIFSFYNIAKVGYWQSASASYILTSILSFFLNKYFTFNVKYWSLFMIFKFIITIVISYLIAYGIAKPVINYLLIDSPKKIRENLALLTGMCLFSGINYIGQRFIVFKINKKQCS
jgi:putative flippase GtrA